MVKGPNKSLVLLLVYRLKLPNTGGNTISPYRKGLTTALALLVLAVGGCSATGRDSQETKPLPKAKVEATTYRGRDLLCIVDGINSQQESYDCDFVGFYADPSYVAPNDIPRIGEDELREEVSAYQGGTIHCLRFAANAINDLRTCDYVRFHQEQSAQGSTTASAAPQSPR